MKQLKTFDAIFGDINLHAKVLKHETGDLLIQ